MLGKAPIARTKPWRAPLHTSDNPPYAQLPLSPVAPVHSAELRAGFAERDITPEIPDSWADLDGNAQFDPDIDSWVDGNGNGEFDAVWMAGFQNNRPAQGVELPLKAVATVLDDGEQRLAIVAADTIGLMRAFVEDLRSHVPEELGLDYVMVHATHNHEGPDTQGLWGASPLPPGWTTPTFAFFEMK